MPKGKFWTQDEINFVKENYGKMSRGQISKKINRTYKAVESKIKELELKNTERTWKEEEIEFVLNNYKVLSYKEIGKKIGRTKNAVQCKMRKLGLCKPEKYSYNVDFFNIIDSEEKAYWLGFIFADGWISNSELGIELALKDIEHLKKFNKSIEGNIEIKKKTNYHNDDFIKAEVTYSCIIRLYRTKIVKDLQKYGITNNKTYDDCHIPKLIPHNYIRDFIRGFFDGDGNVWIDRKKNKTLKYTIYNASYTLLNDIKEELYRNNIYSQIVADNRDLYKKTTTCYRLIIGGISNTYNYYHYMYDNSIIYLERKYMYAIKNIEEFNIKERAYKANQRNACLSN